MAVRRLAVASSMVCLWLLWLAVGGWFSVLSCDVVLVYWKVEGVRL